jgi:hypothetical protein
MVEMQLNRCEHQALGGVFASIDRITQDRPPALREMRADLVLSSRLQPHAKLGDVSALLENFIFRDRELSLAAALVVWTVPSAYSTSARLDPPLGGAGAP